jgi:putative DNA-invertase from lambdoid prophage Rac
MGKRKPADPGVGRVRLGVMGRNQGRWFRVSTTLRDVDSQKLKIVEYTYAEGLQPVEFIEETNSGKIPISERKLQQVVDSMVLGDTLIVSELSTLGRNMVDVPALRRSVA